MMKLFNWLNCKLILFLPKTITIDGIKFYFNRSDRFVALLFWKYGLLEKRELQLLLRFLNDDSILIDIGANMGIFTFKACKKLVSGKIISFEPDKSHFNCLKETVNNNNINNVQLQNQAVTDRSGTMWFNNRSMNGGDFRVNSAQKGVEVETVSLDEFLGPGFKADIIKMDIQGAELLALKGMENLLMSNTDILIFCEFWPKGMRLLNIDTEEFISFIESLKFNIYLIDKTLKPITIDQFKNIESGSNFILTWKRLT